MENLPLYIPLVFGITVLAGLYGFYKASGNSKGFLWLAIAWIILQTILSLEDFYTVQTGPPRIALLAAPPILFGLIYFLTKAGKAFLSRLDLATITLLHLVRIPVELVLFWLFVHHMIPKAMTFEGRNFDILSGFTAPLIYYFGFVKKTLSRRVIIVWNFICLGLLLNVVTIGVSSAIASPPMTGNIHAGIAIQYFPFVLLPGFLVSLVLLSHVAAIRRLFMSVSV